ncbi:MAG: LuxR C-terminal-related transcriptional regulator [Opitutales bacterium]|nr:LuxR C-terminal-related transcriptional regulator [Opitutales bacterium]
MQGEYWNRLHHSVARLFRPGLHLTTFMPRIAEAVRRTVDCDLCTVGILDLPSKDLEVYYDENSPDFTRAMEGYAAHMHKYPLFCYDPWVAEGKPFFRGDFFSERQFRNLDIFADSFRVAGVSDHAAIPILTDEKAIIFAGLERSGRSFSEKDREALTLLQPHLVNARNLARATSPVNPDEIRQSHFVGLGLTPRETDVLIWMTRGKSHGEIGSLMRLKTQTIKGYARNIYAKLGVDNRHAATLRALEIVARMPMEQGGPQLKRAKVQRI